MTPVYEMLATARAADVLRESDERRRRSLAGLCRRWLLGVLPITQRCEASAAC